MESKTKYDRGQTGTMRRGPGMSRRREGCLGGTSEGRREPNRDGGLRNGVRAGDGEGLITTRRGNHPLAVLHPSGTAGSSGAAVEGTGPGGRGGTEETDRQGAHQDPAHRSMRETQHDDPIVQPNL